MSSHLNFRVYLTMQSASIACISLQTQNTHSVKCHWPGIIYLPLSLFRKEKKPNTFKKQMSIYWWKGGGCKSLFLAFPEWLMNDVLQGIGTKWEIDLDYLLYFCILRLKKVCENWSALISYAILAEIFIIKQNWRWNLYISNSIVLIIIFKLQARSRKAAARHPKFT